MPRGRYTYADMDREAHGIVDEWAFKNNFQILVRERKQSNKGPFIGRATHFQPVFRIVLREAGGRKRVAWVRCRRDPFGTVQEDITVIWEDEWRPTEPPIS